MEGGYGWVGRREIRIKNKTRKQTPNCFGLLWEKELINAKWGEKKGKHYSLTEAETWRIRVKDSKESPIKL